MPARRPLEITRIDAIPVALPLIKTMTLARTQITRATNVLVKVELRNGAVGWGEAATMPTPKGENLTNVMRAITAHIVPALLGKDASQHASLIAGLERRRTLSRAALSASDMALLDALGHSYGVPVNALLGGWLHDTVNPMWLLGGKTIEADLDEAQQMVKRGYSFFKVKVGAKALPETIGTIKALRRKLGPRVRLCADANMGLSARAAATFLNGVAKADLLYLEQPYATDALSAMARLARSTRIPIGIDESVYSVSDIVAHHDARAASGAAIKSITLGSLAATVAAAHTTQALGMAVNISSKIAESSVGAAALVHVASAVSEAAWGISPTNCYIADDIARSPLVPVQGRIAIPTGPGLGVEVDMRVVERHRIR